VFSLLKKLADFYLLNVCCVADGLVWTFEVRDFNRETDEYELVRVTSGLFIGEGLNRLGLELARASSILRRLRALDEKLFNIFQWMNRLIFRYFEALEVFQQGGYLLLLNLNLIQIFV